MFLILFLLFTLIPALEIYVLIQVGKSIGAFPTLWIVLGTGVLGAWAVKLQGALIWRKFYQKMGQNKLPTPILLQGILVFIGGILLVTPGFITDTLGLSFILPPFRGFYVSFLINFFKNKIQKQGHFKVSHSGSNYDGNKTRFTHHSPFKISFLSIKSFSSSRFDEFTKEEENLDNLKDVTPEEEKKS